MLDIKRMEKAFEVLIDEDRLIQGIKVANLYVYSCENEVAISAAALLAATDELSEAQLAYQDKPTSENMWSFKISFNSVTTLSTSFESHKANLFAARRDLEELQSKHAELMPEFFDSQIYVCRCVI